MIDGAFTFDGSTSYMDSGADYEVSNGEKGWTQEYWYRTDSASTLQHFMSAEDDEWNANWTALYQSRLALWNRSPGYWRYGDTIHASNTWYHCAFVYNGGGKTAQFYINGEPEGGDHVGNDWNYDGGYKRLLARYFGRYEFSGSYNRYWDGQIAVMKLYNQALSAGAVKQNFEALRGRFGI